MVRIFIAVTQEDSMKKPSNFGQVPSTDLGTIFVIYIPKGYGK